MNERSEHVLILLVLFLMTVVAFGYLPEHREEPDPVNRSVKDDVDVREEFGCREDEQPVLTSDGKECWEEEPVYDLADAEWFDSDSCPGNGLCKVSENVYERLKARCDREDVHHCSVIDDGR